jgi:hypothetical protein
VRIPDSVLAVTYVPAISTYALTGAYICAALALLDRLAGQQRTVRTADLCQLGNHTYCTGCDHCHCHELPE